MILIQSSDYRKSVQLCWAHYVFYYLPLSQLALLPLYLQGGDECMGGGWNCWASTMISFTGRIGKWFNQECICGVQTRMLAFGIFASFCCGSQLFYWWTHIWWYREKKWQVLTRQCSNACDRWQRIIEKNVWDKLQWNIFSSSRHTCHPYQHMLSNRDSQASEHLLLENDYLGKPRVPCRSLIFTMNVANKQIQFSREFF